MATIMAHTCVHPDDELVFDAYTDSFILLTEQATELCSIPGGSLDETPPPLTDGMSFDTSRSIVDVGCLPQLYYTALKCRIHHVRHRAVELLQPLIHREGFWDARIAATVARRVVEVEEGDYYKSFGIMGDDCRETSLPPLPECYRLRDVEAVYSASLSTRCCYSVGGNRAAMTSSGCALDNTTFSRSVGWMWSGSD